MTIAPPNTPTMQQPEPRCSALAHASIRRAASIRGRSMRSSARRLKRGLLWRSGQHFGASQGDLERIGGLSLGEDLAPGEWRWLEAADLEPLQVRRMKHSLDGFWRHWP